MVMMKRNTADYDEEEVKETEKLGELNGRGGRR